MYLIKLGGSVVTVKSRYRTFRWKVTAEILRIISGIQDQVILVHGGGSFGHILAKQYGIPGEITAERREGYSKVHMDMLDLNHRICKLVQSQIGPCVSIPPGVMMENLEESVSYYVGKKIIPVTFGDTIFRGNRVEIISGDDIMFRIARKLSPEKVIFMSDVDGIYSSNPKEDFRARLIPVLSGKVKTSITMTDVTGGMKGKIDCMKKIAKLGSTVYLINGKKPERLATIGKDGFIGTVIE